MSSDEKQKDRTASVTEAIEDSPETNLSARKWTTTRLELWSYYLYYVGNNGLSGFNFGPSQFQNLLFLAGYDPTIGPGAACGDNGCVLPYLGRIRDTAGVSFAWLGVKQPSEWRAGVALYILGLITYQCSLTFWTAAFPGLAYDLPEVEESRKEFASGKKSSENHARFHSLARNRVSNISFAVCSAGEIIILAIMVGILKGLHAEDSTENNTKAFSVLIAFSGGAWLVCALPWFIFERRRPGLDLPPGTSLLTIGFKQVYVAFRECLRLKQTFLYLIFYFLMGDVLNTTVTVIATLQNSVVLYSTLDLTLLLIVGIVAQGFGIYLFWLVQKRYKISTKTMLSFNVFWIIILTIWGLIGVHTNKFGFKHVWEIWAYQAFYGLMVGKTSAFIGPLVSSAIITASDDNDNMPFAFLFTLGVLSTIFLWMVDVEKSRMECKEFIAAEAEREVFKQAGIQTPTTEEPK
ncbi:hypothetical protein NLJ89_g4370 [Agrocybe chaxingu]|uniref:Autophagy-related protein n=1 Tax=Agrocybe chaxingu TaxID=84603 RepID=A0A9W8K323_9AGAR|nr:hypothetical protein NLJ89_g4370 [Agrocybe chaxingu]